LTAAMITSAALAHASSAPKQRELYAGLNGQFARLLGLVNDTDAVPTTAVMTAIKAALSQLPSQ